MSKTVLAMLTAEVAFKCAEKGMNWEATRAKVAKLLDGPDEEKLPWRPIEELTVETRYGDEAGFLLMAPELVDEDCNVHGVGLGHWADDGKLWHMTQEQADAHVRTDDDGCWMACKWSMTNDEWSHVPCTPTHYLRLTGA